ncbi:hypothetical protein B9T29_12965 [Acinetobacter sp. ANC 3903]|uniref:DUF945 family protein n=1 Tax=Acinetobacter sp. ANC 3903 TaxID=1977883 RepID=UPI000A356861|nr:DUF945 family protein [Acinetobacter sp. ANC 3903]OTG59147.1 hypothetical protein B9T29_12965 [Acinetobacter sp. ANC 3903]
MSKLTWGVGSIVGLVTAVIGGNLYADKSLTSYYQQYKKSNFMSIQYKNFNMGAMQGSADWTAEFTLDPCKPKDVLILSGTDAIKRSWNGYHIESLIHLKQGNGVFQALMKQPLTAQTKIDWLGKMRTSLVTPVYEKNEAEIQTRIDPMTFTMLAKSKDDRFDVLNVKFQIPNMTVNDKLGQMQIRDLGFETNQGLNTALNEGETRLNIASIQRTDRNVQQFGSGELKGFALRVNTQLDKNKVAFDTQVKIDEMTMYKTPSFHDFEINFKLAALNRQKVQNFFDLLEKSSAACIAKEELNQDVVSSFLAIVNDGFAFESQNNQIKVGEGYAKASLTGKVMPGHQSSFESLVKMAPNLVEYQANVEYDKKIMKTIMKNYLQQGGKTLSDQELEQMLNGMQQSLQAKREGDILKIGIEYKYGEKKFLN